MFPSTAVWENKINCFPPDHTLIVYFRCPLCAINDDGIVFNNNELFIFFFYKLLSKRLIYFVFFGKTVNYSVACHIRCKLSIIIITSFVCLDR